MKTVVAFATVLAACAFIGADAGRGSSHNRHGKTTSTTTAGTLPQAPGSGGKSNRPGSGKPTSGNRQNAGINANAYCFDCLMRTNNKDLFANPVDCHSYFQCVYVNETDAIGILRMCQPGTYFDETRLTCRAEGAVPCQPSPCSNPTVAALGCYQLPGQSCRQYFTCDTSEPSCCPQNTRFDPNTCGCTPDPTCIDYCQTLSNVTLPPSSNETACTDPFGNTLLPVEGHPELFQLGDFTLACAPGTNFNLTECACTIEVNVTRAGGAPLPVAGPRQCQLWLPFDTDLQDKSINHFTTFAYGNAELDVTTAASGAGSLRVNDGRLEIPGMKTMEFNNPDGVSWCFSYRCANGACSNGGILSNDRDMAATFFTIIGAISGNNLVARVMTEEGSVSLQGTASAGTWNSACVVYRENATVELYNNGALTGVADLTGPLTVTHCPYVVGNDQFYGNFDGNIDNVLVCNSPLSMSEIQAYSSGDIGMLESAGLIPEAENEEATTTTTEAPSTRQAGGRTTRGSRPGGVAGGSQGNQGNQANQPTANRPTTGRPTANQGNQGNQPTANKPTSNQGNQPTANQDDQDDHDDEGSDE